MPAAGYGSTDKLKDAPSPMEEDLEASRTPQHRWFRFSLVVAAVLVYIVTCVLNGLASNDAGINAGIYANTTGIVSDAHPTGLTPSGWAFSIWGVIYFWQCVWLIYAITTLFRKGVNGYLYYSPDILPAYLYVAYIINNVTNVGWLVVWSREEMVTALVLILIATLSLYVCSAASYFGVTNNQDILIKNGLGRDVWYMRWFVQNGIGVYDTWLSVATLINLAIVLGEETSMSMVDASTLCLVILGVEILGWFFLETFMLDRFVRYVISPYFVYTFALIGVLDNTYVAGERNSIIVVCCLALSCVVLVAKLIIMIVRHRKDSSQQQFEVNP